MHESAYSGASVWLTYERPLSHPLDDGRTIYLPKCFLKVYNWLLTVVSNELASNRKHQAYVIEATERVEVQGE